MACVINSKKQCLHILEYYSKEYEGSCVVWLFQEKFKKNSEHKMIPKFQNSVWKNKIIGCKNILSLKCKKIRMIFS